jgi:hypothetical protein
MATTLRWIRNNAQNQAERTDGFTIRLLGTHWVVSKNGRTKVLPTEPYPAFLDRAIEAVDRYFPPGKWGWKEDRWILGNWIVQPEAGKWVVRRINDAGTLDHPTRQEFATADRARTWVEVRRDRSGIGLRGPRPRSGARATAKLPDLRVTQEERDHALLILEKVGLSYAAFVRAMLDWANTYVVEQASWYIDSDDNGEPLVVPRDDLDDLESGPTDDNDDGGAWDDIG